MGLELWQLIVFLMRWALIMAIHYTTLKYLKKWKVNRFGSLQEVLEFYRPFAQTFSRNLSLTFDLSKRMVFSKVTAYKY